MNNTGNIYEYNIAKLGGAFYIESSSIFHAFYEKAHHNRALSNGGVYFITSRSYFSLFSVNFNENFAKRIDEEID